MRGGCTRKCICEGVINSISIINLAWVFNHIWGWRFQTQADREEFSLQIIYVWAWIKSNIGCSDMGIHVQQTFCLDVWDGFRGQAGQVGRREGCLEGVQDTYKILHVLTWLHLFTQVSSVYIAKPHTENNHLPFHRINNNHHEPASIIQKFRYDQGN